jgi:hypothetical protein
MGIHKYSFLFLFCSIFLLFFVFVSFLFCFDFIKFCRNCFYLLCFVLKFRWTNAFIFYYLFVFLQNISVSFFERSYPKFFERKVVYYCFVHHKPRINQNVYFRYRNELKIRPKNELVLCTLTSLVSSLKFPPCGMVGAPYSPCLSISWYTVYMVD